MVLKTDLDIHWYLHIPYIKFNYIGKWCWYFKFTTTLQYPYTCTWKTNAWDKIKIIFNEMSWILIYRSSRLRWNINLLDAAESNCSILQMYILVLCITLYQSQYIRLVWTHHRYSWSLSSQVYTDTCRNRPC